VRFFTAAGLVNRLEEAQEQYQLDRSLDQLDWADAPPKRVFYTVGQAVVAAQRHFESTGYTIKTTTQKANLACVSGRSRQNENKSSRISSGVKLGLSSISGRSNPRYDPAVPLPKELVFVHVDATDGTKFDALLTRVPGVGEEIIVENRSYQIIRVQHAVVNNDGRAEFGWHAFVEAILRSED
jgi:hypothetical protein